MNFQSDITRVRSSRLCADYSGGLITELIVALLGGANLATSPSQQATVAHLERCVECSWTFLRAAELVTARPVWALRDSWIRPEERLDDGTLDGLLTLAQLQVGAGRSAGDARAMVNALSVVGLCRRMHGDAGEARLVHELALRLATGEGDAFSTAVSHADLAFIALQERRFDEALPHLDAALLHAEELGDQEFQQVVLLLEARVRDAQGDVRRALVCYRAAWELARAGGDVAGQARAVASIASIRDEVEQVAHAVLEPRISAGTPDRGMLIPSPERLGPTGGGPAVTNARTVGRTVSDAEPEAVTVGASRQVVQISARQVVEYAISLPAAAGVAVQRVDVQDILQDLQINWFQEPAVDDSGHVTAVLGFDNPIMLPVPEGQDFDIELTFVHTGEVIAACRVPDQERFHLFTTDGIRLEGRLSGLDEVLLARLSAWLQQWSMRALPLAQSDYLLRLFWRPVGDGPV